MLVKTYGSAIYGINAITITVEVNVEQGVNFLMVGLPDNAVKESHQRIDSALKYNNCTAIQASNVPKNNTRISSCSPSAGTTLLLYQ